MGGEFPSWERRTGGSVHGKLPVIIEFLTTGLFRGTVGSMKHRFSTLAAALWFVGATAQEADPLPDFHLKDENMSSPRFTKQVSPHDYILQVSGYYFGSSS